MVPKQSWRRRQESKKIMVKRTEKGMCYQEIIIKKSEPVGSESRKIKSIEHEMTAERQVINTFFRRSGQGQALFTQHNNQ